jgi:chromosomal replication initiator protein
MFCNPLFISGPSGVGKSHISHAIGNSYQMNFPEKRVRYISSDKFTSDFIFTIQGNDPVEQKKFKEYFKSIDLLIFDDIQNLIGKTRTIDEFFIILNNLIMMRKRIIIISDRDFEELRDFPNRIITRISSGFSYNMNKPDYESRIAILKMKATIQHLDDIPDEVYEFISSSLDNNVRELEGALNTLFYSSMFENEGEIDLPFTIKILGNKYKRSKFTKLNYSSIKNLVSETMSIKLEDLSSKKRTKQIALSRKIAIYLCRELLEDSFSRIAKEFNLKDHTSSKYNYDQMIQILKRDSSIVTIVENIRKKLTT